MLLTLQFGDCTFGAVVPGSALQNGTELYLSVRDFLNLSLSLSSCACLCSFEQEGFVFLARLPCLRRL